MRTGVTRIQIILFVILAALGAGAAHGQKISVRTLAMTSKEMPEFYFRTDDKEEPLAVVEWPTRQPSERVVALRDGSLPLYTRELDDEGKESLSVAKTIKIPNGASQILLFGWSDGEKTRYHAIEDDILGAKFNDWMLINFSSKDIAFRVGDESLPVKINSGASKLYRIAVPKNKGATVVGQAPIKDEVKTFYSTYLPVKEGQRTLMIFADDGKKIRTKRIVDTLIPNKPRG